MLNRKVLKKFSIVLSIFLLILRSTSSQVQRNFVCDGNSCALQKITSTNELINELEENRGVPYSYYDPYYGQRSGMKNFQEITVVSCNNTKMNKLPQLFFEKFSKLSTLKASNVEIQEINREDFKFASQLKFLDLSKNGISRLDNMVFMFLPQLTELDLSSNQISTLHDGAFEDISKVLTKINLSFNKIQIFNENHFVNLGKSSNFTLFINMENNEINEIPVQNSTTQTIKIKFLDLQNNQIKNFESSCLEIANLLINNNQLETLKIHGVDVLQANNNKLSKLFISNEMKEVSVINNEIRELNCDKNLTVESLLLSDNKFTSEELEKLKNASKLKFLDLSNTNLGPLKVDAFAEMSELEELNLNNAKIIKISFGLFSHQKNLETLKIADNNLGFIDYHMFSSLDNLKAWDISGNNLTKLKDYENFTQIFPNLTSIGLENNAWNCEYLSKMRINLENQGIRVNDPVNPVKNDSSIKGIGCSTSKHSKINQVSPEEDPSKILEKLNEIIEATNNVTTEINAMKANETVLKESIFQLRNEVFELKSENLKNKIYATNATNTNEVRNIVETMNNVTLERQKLLFDQLVQRINEQNLEIQKQKLEISKFAGEKVQAQPMSMVQEKSSPGHSTTEVIAILIAFTGLIGVIIFTVNYFKNYIKSKIPRMPQTRAGSVNTISTIVDSSDSVL